VWQTPDGERLVGTSPSERYGGLFGAELRRDVLDHHHHCQVPQPLPQEPVRECGIDISVGQIDALLSGHTGAFLGREGPVAHHRVGGQALDDMSNATSNTWTTPSGLCSTDRTATILCFPPRLTRIPSSTPDPDGARLGAAPPLTITQVDQPTIQFADRTHPLLHYAETRKPQCPKSRASCAPGTPSPSTAETIRYVGMFAVRRPMLDVLPQCH
jgi:hypothetical protein